MQVAQEKPVLFLTPSTGLAAFASVAVGSAQWFASPITSDRVLPIVLGLTTGVTMSFGIAWGERASRGALVTLLLAGFVQAAVSTWLSLGVAYVMMMPVLSCVVLYLSTRAAVGLALLSVATFLATSFQRNGVAFRQCAGEALGYSSAVLFVAVFTLFAKRERYARREVERLSAQVEELAMAKERNRIARELHDTLGHVLTVANVQLEAVRAAPDGREERLDRVQTLLKSGLRDLRKTVSAWRDTPMSEARFSAALLELVEHTQATGLRVAIETSGAPRLLAADVGFTLYRGAQEALTNVHRHARATTVKLKLDYAPASVSLRIADDGVGEASALEMGNGLRGLEERLGLLGGSIALEAVEPRGVALTLCVPA